MKFCPNCGMELKDTDEHCTSCGYVIENKEVHQSNESNESNTNSNIGLIVGGWICTAGSTLFFPVLLGAGAVICGYLLSRKSKEHGVVMMIAGVGCTIFGVILGSASY